jgi:hypothetical protein
VASDEFVRRRISRVMSNALRRQTQRLAKTCRDAPRDLFRSVDESLFFFDERQDETRRHVDRNRVKKADAGAVDIALSPFQLLVFLNIHCSVG